MKETGRYNYSPFYIVIGDVETGRYNYSSIFIVVGDGRERKRSIQLFVHGL